MAPSSETTGQLPHCIFTQLRVETCPGYRARHVAERESLWLIVPGLSYVTCVHLQSEAVEGGLVGACGHPQDLAGVRRAAERANASEVATRAGAGAHL